MEISNAIFFCSVNTVKQQVYGLRFRGFFFFTTTNCQIEENNGKIYFSRCLIFSDLHFNMSRSLLMFFETKFTLCNFLLSFFVREKSII